LGASGTPTGTVFKRLETASGEEQEREAANAFVAWVEAEGLL
jgi:hypothetical protein